MSEARSFTGVGVAVVGGGNSAGQAVMYLARYASHVYDPFFLAGIETLAYELWEQMNRRAPEAVVLPVGNGILLLGVADDGTLVGLETDKFENEDRCRLHFKNLLNHHLGAESARLVRFDL